MRTQQKRNPERDFFFAGGTDCRASVSAGVQWQGRSDVGIAPTKSKGIRIYGGGQSRPPLRCKARSRAQRDGEAVVPQGHLFRCAPRQDAVPYGRFNAPAPQGGSPSGRRLSAGVFVYRAAEQIIPPVMQCAHLLFRRQQASSHPLTCHGMVPQASRTALFRHNKYPPA